MAATLIADKYNISEFGSETRIPDNDIARLMYYMNCVCVVLEINENSALTDYKNYDVLDNDQAKLVYALALAFQPALLIQAGVFIVDSTLLDGDYTNQFFEITNEKIGFHVNQELMIGGKTVRVKKLMACNNKWLSSYYFNPIDRIKMRLNSGLPIKPVVNTYNQNASYISTQEIVRIETIPIIRKKFEMDPIYITCERCGKNITTHTEKKFNCLACCCFIFFPALYCLVQLCKGKNLLCCDVHHSCPKCGKYLGGYEACD